MSKDLDSPKSRPFPWQCAQCGQRTMKPEVMDYTTEVVHDGRPYTVNVPSLSTLRCQNPDCRTMLLDTDANRRITQAFRRAANLLEPEEIRRRREELGLTQAALAERLEVGTATVSRWETGAQVQQRSLDKLLRLFFDLPEVRRALEPPSPGKFRCLQATPELRLLAGRFQLTPGKRSAAEIGAEDAEDKMASAAASRPGAE